MSLIVAWIVFPLVLAALCVGCGLLLERVFGITLPGALLPALGLAVIVVVAQFLTRWDSTAGLATPVVVSLAVAGLGLALLRGRRRVEPWAVAAALGLFAVYAAPIVLSGQPTVAGYLKLDDTATWLALTDRVMEHGHSLSGLRPSSYEATLSFTLGKGYPVGAFLPLGIVGKLVGRDLAWLIAPYMATLGALLALALWELARPLVDSARFRALVAFGAAQAALLYGYYLWGGVKEVLVASLVAAGCVIAAGSRAPRRFAVAAPLLVIVLAIVGSLSLAGAVWMGPAVGYLAVRARRAELGALQGAMPRVLALVAIAVPALLAVAFISPTRAAFTSESQLGNLLGPLSPAQVLGIWPAGDFRLSPDLPLVSAALMAAVAVGALAAAVMAARRAAAGPLLYLAGTVGVAAITWWMASPWLAAKALAIASPAPIFGALAFAGGLLRSGRRVPAAILVAAVGGGILWSNSLAYQDVNLAPHDQLAELETIGHRIAGQGPTLMTEYQPYGARHFLRDADPEGASELRRRRAALLNGDTLPKGASADTDRFRLGGLMAYRTLVLRRSPVQSRPPSAYRLIWRGDYYEAWQRPVGSEGAVIDHLGLGEEEDPGGVPRCADVRHLAREAQPTGRLAAVSRASVGAISLSQTRHRGGWDSSDHPTSLLPGTPEPLAAGVRIGRAADYEIWLGGSVRPEADLLVDGRPAGEVRHQLNNEGEYIRLGRARLDPGRHTVTVHLHGPDLHPGSGGRPDPIGRLILGSQEAADTQVSHFRPSQASALCGRRWDWIEAVGG